MKRKQKSLDCSICHKPGHNKRTCKYNIVEEETNSSVRQKLHVRRGYDEVGHGEVEHEQNGTGRSRNWTRIYLGKFSIYTKK